jgi:hypothetical protein
MATYYISTTGNDGNSGSIGSPWLNLHYACEQAVALGDIIHINAGIYTETEKCILAAGVSIEGVGDTSHMKLSYNTSYDGAINLSSGSAGTNGNQSIRYVKLDGQSITSGIAVNVENRSNVKIHHCTIVDFERNGVALRGDCTKSSGFSPGQEGSAPSVYETGNEIYSCSIINSGGYLNQQGALIHIDSQSDFTIHDNILTQDSRAGENGDIIDGWGCWFKGLHYYNNISTKQLLDASNYWNFHFEVGTTLGGNNIHDNHFLGGGIALDIAAIFNTRGSYAYAWWIHDNHFECDRQVSSGESWAAPAGIYLESTNSDFIIERNYFKNYVNGVYLAAQEIAGMYQDSISVQYNIFDNMGYSDAGNWVYCFDLRATTGANRSLTNIHYYNNVIKSTSLVGIFNLYSEASGCLIDNIYIKNNIIYHVASSQGWLVVGPGNGTIDTVEIKNNIIYDCPNNEAFYYFSGAPSISNLIQSDYYVSDPKFVGASDFHLKIDSPARETGIDVGLESDFSSNVVSSPPDIGAYEYGSYSVIPVTAVTVTGAGDATTITVDNGTLQMSAHIDPHNATDQTVVWSVINGTGSATISATGLLTAITNGTVTVKATSNG